MAKATEAPKFNIIVMLILGVIIGMLAYFLVFYSRANLLGVADVYPSWISYGNGNVLGKLSETQITVLEEDVINRVVWYVRENTALDFHTYAKNIGDASTGSGTKVRFCLNAAETCLESTSYNSTLQSGRIGNDVNVGALAGGSRIYKKATTTVTPRVGTHVYTACMVGSTGEPVSSLTNNCTSLTFVVSPVSAIPGGTFLSRVVCTTTSGCKNGDFFGTTAFVEPDDLFGDDDPLANWLPGWFVSSAYAQPVRQCHDALDNDNDGLIDFPADPGCRSDTDNREDNQNRPQCPGNSQKNCEV